MCRGVFVKNAIVCKGNVEEIRGTSVKNLDDKYDVEKYSLSAL